MSMIGQQTEQFDEAFWDEHYETLVVSDEAHDLLPTLDANIFDRQQQDQLRQLLESPELQRATARWERWSAAAAQNALEPSRSLSPPLEGEV